MKPREDQADRAQLALEEEVVAAMYEAGLSTSDVVDNFSTWLLVGTASAAAFMLGNVQDLEPVMGLNGVVVGGAFLTASCLCGVIAKYFSVRCAINKSVRRHLGESGLQVRINGTGIDFDRMLESFVQPLLIWQRWRVRRQGAEIKRGISRPYDQSIRFLNSLHLWAALQTVLAIGFLLAEFWMIGANAKW